MNRIEFDTSGHTSWCGYGDYALVSPDGAHCVELTYDGEPPHGDSYHRASVDGRFLPGFVWGGSVGFSGCSRYFVCSWMLRKFERSTLVVDLEKRCYATLPEYLGQFRIAPPWIIGEGEYAGKQHDLGRVERWVTF